MRNAVIMLILGLVVSVQAAESPLPPEVDAFVRDRDLCDHFRGEPHEGNTPEQIKRREFIFESLEIYCPGTDRRLAALKKRYKNNEAIMSHLNQYEERIEGRTNAP